MTRRAAIAGAGLAWVVGAVEFLSLMGAFGPVSCWRGQTSSGTASSSGASSTTGTEVTSGCNAGIDYLLSGAGGNAPVLFSWAFVLLALVSLGLVATWTGRRWLLWTTIGAGAVISLVGFMSIGLYFAIPTLFLLLAGVLVTIEAREGPDGGSESAASGST